MNYFDLHCDTPYRCFTENKNLSDKELSVNFSVANNFDKWFQCFAIWIPDNIENPFSFYKSVYKDFNNKLNIEKPKNLSPVLTVEGGRVAEKNIDNLNILKSNGIRAITLSWNGENEIAGGVESDAGLKSFGADFIKELNSLGILCDLSHLNKKSFYKAAELAKMPIATHSCVFEINNHKRNLTKEQIKLISEKNGVVGLCLYKDFLGGNDIFESIYKHIYFLLENGFEDTIAIGSDFDGCKTDISLSDIFGLYSFLSSENISNEILDKIFFYNSYRVFSFFDKI